MAPTLTETPIADLERLSARYVALLEAEEIPAPLSQPIAAAAVLADLFALAELPVPAYITQALDTAGLP